MSTTDGRKIDGTVIAYTGHYYVDERRDDGAEMTTLSG